MNQQHLKNAINNHLNKQSLSEKQLDHLLALQDRYLTRPPARKSMPLRWAAAFTFVLTFLASILYFNLTPQFALDERIGNEVAKNHIKLKPLEIQTSSIQVIRNYFTELDFSPIESTLVRKTNKSLIGGRYCSIQGITAAQLRLKDNKSGQVQSLYQTLYKPEVFKDLPQLEEGKKPVTVYSKGLEVDIWVEKGLLFALTREVSEQDNQQ